MFLFNKTSSVKKTNSKKRSHPKAKKRTLKKRNNKKSGSPVFENVKRGSPEMNKINGPATVKFQDNAVEEGTFIAGKLTGQGTITKYDGKKIFAVLKGEFKNGRLNGKGTKETKSFFNSLEEGTFKDGLLHGLGKKSYLSSKETQEGNFKDGELSGKGKKTYGDSKNKLISEQGIFVVKMRGLPSMLSKGKKVYRNGHTEEGKFKITKVTEDGDVYFKEELVN